jgi:hypothetical protein
MTAQVDSDFATLDGGRGRPDAGPLDRGRSDALRTAGPARARADEAALVAGDAAAGMSPSPPGRHERPRSAWVSLAAGSTTATADGLMTDHDRIAGKAASGRAGKVRRR